MNAVFQQSSLSLEHQIDAYNLSRQRLWNCLAARNSDEELAKIPSLELEVDSLSARIIQHKPADLTEFRSKFRFIMEEMFLDKDTDERFKRLYNIIDQDLFILSNSNFE